VQAAPVDAMAHATGEMAVFTASAGAAGFLIEFLLAHALSVRAYGNMATLLALAAQLSVGQTAVQLAVARDTARRGAMAASWWRFALLASVGLSCVGLTAGWWLEGIWRLPSGTLPFVFLVAVAWFYLGVFRGIAQGLEQYRLFGVSLLVENALRLGVTAVLIGPLGVWGGLIGLAVGAAGTAVWATWAVNPPRQRDAPIPWDALAWTAFGVGLTALTPRLDMLVVKHAWNATQAGVWAALSLFGQAFAQLPWLAATVMFPKVVRDHRARYTYFRFSVALSLGVLLLAAVLGYFLVPHFARFFFAGRYNDWLYLFGPYLFAIIPVSLYALWISFAVANDARHRLVVLAGGLVLYLFALLLHHHTMDDVLWDYLTLAGVEAYVFVADWLRDPQPDRAPKPTAPASLRLRARPRRPFSARPTRLRRRVPSP